MCGISGIYNLNNNPVSLETLKRFTDSMVHRGPNGAGYELFDNETLGLGQRRLSILDLSEAGKQPMSYADGRYWITYNGEIFNFIEVREELQQLGHAFKSDTDTEVILAAYAQWGKACLDRFNGMWAFAIWDKQEKILFLARDRFGIKPLYYTFINYSIAFASETIAFKNLDGFKRNINGDRLKEIVENSLAHEGLGLTIYDNIYQILPGHTLTIQKGKPLPKQKRWYDIRAKIIKGNTNTYEQNVKIFYDLFENACKIRMRSDVPLASALSGGLDSSSVYSMVHHISAKSNSNNRQATQCKKAITAVFPGTEMDEKQYAEVVAEKWGKENWVCISNNMNHLAQEIEQVTTKFDTIAGTPMNAITKIYEGVRNEQVIVSLDGHGVDEMLFGYRYMLDKLFYYYLEIGSIEKAILVKEVLVNLYHESNRESVSKRLGSLISQVEKNKNSLKGKLKSLLNPTKPKVDLIKIPNESNQLSDDLYHFEAFPYEQQILLNDFFIYSLPTYLRDFDRASMQHSVEVRMPFMDYRLVEFCFQLPIEHKLGMGYTKRILRDAVKEIVPKSIVERTYKVGIGSPLVSWFNNELNNYSQELLSTGELDLFLKELNFQDKSVYLEQLQNKTLTDALAVQLWQAINYKTINE
jgi:asparagine synthase (glutamine-hydrolysing)